MNKKMQLKRRKALNKLQHRMAKSAKRHEISLAQTQTFNHKLEIELRRTLERGISKAFPNPQQRVFYISNLIKELEDEIALNAKLESDES